MSEQGLWLKLWCSALTDLNLDNLDVADFGRWCKLALYIKQHGEQGKITITEPARSIVSKMQLECFNDMINKIQQFPNVTVSKTVSGNGNHTVSFDVSFKNWHKYQGDYSTPRVRRHRKKKLFQNGVFETHKEEKRREEKRVLYSSFLSENKNIIAADVSSAVSFPLEKRKVVDNADNLIVSNSVSPKKPKKKGGDEDFELPDWVPAEDWDDYVSMRMKIKKPMTARAKRDAVAELDKLRNMGHSPHDVLARSIFNGWAGLFPLPKKEKEYL